MNESHAMPSPQPSPGIPGEGGRIAISSRLRQEWALPINIVTAALFLIFSKSWLADLSNPAWFAFILLWLFAVILISAFAVVRHAEELAHALGEPLGTLILTLAVTGIEVTMIAAVMYASGGGSSMARDAMFAVVMIVLNGMVGLSLLLGGLRHREQTYNLQGANAFMAVIIPLSVLSLILPNYTLTTPGPSLSSMQSIFLIVMSIGLYGVFLAIQNVRHREYFIAAADVSCRRSCIAQAQRAFNRVSRHHAGGLPCAPGGALQKIGDPDRSRHSGSSCAGGAGGISGGGADSLARIA